MTAIDDGVVPLPQTEETLPAQPGRHSRSGSHAGASRGRRRKLVALVAMLLAMAMVAAAWTWYAKTRKPLSALPGILQQHLPHYQFSIYGVVQPLDVAVSGDGERVYVTESEGSRDVHVFDRDGHEVAQLTPPPDTGATHLPVYLAVEPASGDVYVSDRLTSSVYVYGSDGTFKRTFVPQGDAVGWQPLGLAFDPDGHLYVADVRGQQHRILELGQDGEVLRTMGAKGELAYPNDVTIDPHGGVAVSDSNNGRVVVFDEQGRLATAVNRGVGDGDLGLPRGLTISDADQMLVVDTVNHTVRAYQLDDSGGAVPKYIGSFGEAGPGDGMFAFPNGIATDSRARVYVTDRENNRVQVWSY